LVCDRRCAVGSDEKRFQSRLRATLIPLGLLLSRLFWRDIGTVFAWSIQG
jgi:hypothetical protein